MCNLMLFFFSRLKELCNQDHNWVLEHSITPTFLAETEPVFEPQQLGSREHTFSWFVELISWKVIQG